MKDPLSLKLLDAGGGGASLGGLSLRVGLA